MVLDLIQQFFLDLFNGTEPLFGCPEVNRLLQTLVMRIAVHDIFHAQQCTALIEHRDDLLRAVLNEQAFQFRTGYGSHAAALINRLQQADVVRLADIEVVKTMVRGDMDTAGTVFGTDIVGQDDKSLTAVQRMGNLYPFQFTPAEGTQTLGLLQVQLFRQHRQEVPGEYELAVLRQHFNIRQIRIDRDRLVCRNRPRGRGPDDNPVIGIQDAVAVHHIECYVDCRVLLVKVHDFRVGYSCFTVR